MYEAEKSTLKPVTDIEPASSIYKTIGMMLDTNSYDIFSVVGKEVLTTNVREITNEVIVRIITPYQNHNYEEIDWDLSKVFDTLGSRISRNLSKRSKKRWKTSIRKIDKKIFQLLKITRFNSKMDRKS